MLDLTFHSYLHIYLGWH